MENTKITNICDDGGELKSQNVPIRLMGHCIICLRKVIVRRSGKCETSEYLRSGSRSTRIEIAPKSVVSTPGFLTTFNQVWAVLQTKWKDKNAKTKDNMSSGKIEISLESVLQNSHVSTNVSFSKAPTICQLCCLKVLAVENLMKAVRQQVREIGMLLEEGRRRQDGGSCEFEKTLRDNRLEERVIMATLQFVGIVGSSGTSEGEFQGDLKEDKSSAAAVQMSNMMDMECDDQNSLGNNQIYIDNRNEGRTGGLGVEDDDNDPDYIKSDEEMEEGDDEQDESEEEMEADEEHKNDPDYDEVGEDPLTLFPEKRKKDTSSSKNGNNQFGSGDKEKSTQEIVCTCGKRFQNRNTLRRHMLQNKKTHPDYQNYGLVVGKRQVCELCGEWVMHSDILEHLTGEHLNGQDEWVIRCPNEKCPYMYVSLIQLKQHFKKGPGKQCQKIFKERGGHFCDICGFKASNLLKMKYHVRDKHEEKEKDKKLKCPISGCEETFGVKQSVPFHMHEHRYRPPITEQVCDKCGGSFKIEEMEGHLKEEHGIEEVIGCGQCEMRFSGRDEMVEHLFEHRRTGIFCDICGDKQERFVRHMDFREHYFGVHKLCPKKYKCGECDNLYWREEDKEDHELRQHKGLRKRNSIKGKQEYIVECDVCNVKFVREVNLITHKIKVHGADPLKCDICGETFDEKVKLNKHKKEHAGIVFQKEWRCEVEGCGKIFKKKQNFKRHKEVGHGAVKKHVCEICGKGYCDASTLRDHHDIIHLGKRPWVCDECGERFTSSAVLKTHKLIHTGERPFACDICGQRFRHTDVLKRHVIGHEVKGADFKPNGPMKQIRKRKDQ